MKLWPYRLLAPLDAVCRHLNEKDHLPPIHLRRYVGPLASFEHSGGEFLAYLKLLGGLRADSRLLDIGCGCGLMALLLRDQLDAEGRYVGMDINGEAIAWCRQNITASRANFTFVHSDIRNPRYNPTGAQSAEDYVFPGEPHSFDLILAKSLFTHMRPPEVRHYLAEISRLLAPGGRALLTFFLLNEEQRALAEQGRNAIDFRFGEGDWRYFDADNPEIAVAYEEAPLREMLRATGLHPRGEIHYGTWAGRRDGLSFQDIIIAEPAV